VLSPEEVEQLIGSAHNLMHRTMLMRANFRSHGNPLLTGQLNVISATHRLRTKESLMRTIRSIFSLLLALAASSLAAQPRSAVANPVITTVYVGQNKSPSRIFAYTLKLDLTFAPVSGSPFTALSQHLAPSPNFLFGSDGTSITTYTLDANGAPHATSTINGTAHNDTPAGSAVGPLTFNQFFTNSLYAAEINFQGSDNDAYGGFVVQPNGALTFQFNTPVNVDFNSPLQFFGSALAYGQGCFFANFDLFGFQRANDGTLTPFNPAAAIPPSPSNDLLCPTSTAVSSHGDLAVSYGPAVAGSKQSIAIYHIALPSGGLSLVSTIATNFTAINAMNFSPSGEFLTVASNKGLQFYKLSDAETLTRFGSVIDPSTNFLDVKWDNRGKIYAISNSALFRFTFHATGVTATGTPQSVPNAVSLAVRPVPF
jgi:hypothetical protein